MRFRDNRITLRKNMMGAEIPENFDPDGVLATPREVANRSLTAGLRTVPNRTAQRERAIRPRMRRRGVSVADKPWEQKTPQHYEVDDHGKIRRDGRVVKR
jgi:hypothetical protein